MPRRAGALKAAPGAASRQLSCSCMRSWARRGRLSGVSLPSACGTDGQSALPEIENMEGAAFFAVCEALGVACCQIRAVSNYVGQPFDRWAGGLAVENLTATLTQIFGNDE